MAEEKHQEEDKRCRLIALGTFFKMSSSISAVANVKRFKIDPKALVCVNTLSGDVQIGARTVVSPQAMIKAEAGPIIIGEGNLIEERAVIINEFPSARDDGDGNEDRSDDAKGRVMIIGNGNTFEVGSCCQAAQVGNNNVFEVKSSVGRDVVVSNGCIIGARCSVNSEGLLPENTVICGSEQKRFRMADKPPPQTSQLDFCLKTFSEFHNTYKVRRKATGPSTSGPSIGGPSAPATVPSA